MMIKKIATTLTAVIIACSMLASCGAGSSASDTKTSSQTSSSASRDTSKEDSSGSQKKSAEIFFNKGAKTCNGLNLLLPQTKVERPLVQVQDFDDGSWKEMQQSDLTQGDVTVNVYYSIFFGEYAVKSDDSGKDDNQMLKDYFCSVDSRSTMFRQDDDVEMVDFEVTGEEKVKVLGKEALRLKGYCTDKAADGQNVKKYFEVLLGTYESQDKEDGKLKYYRTLAWTRTDSEENRAKVTALIDTAVSETSYAKGTADHSQPEAIDDGMFFKKEYKKSGELLYLLPAQTDTQSKDETEFVWKETNGLGGDARMVMKIVENKAAPKGDRQAQIKQITDQIKGRAAFDTPLGNTSKEVKYVAIGEAVPTVESDQSVTIDSTQFQKQTGHIKMSPRGQEDTKQINAYFTIYEMFYKPSKEDTAADDYCYWVVISFDDTEKGRQDADQLAETVAKDICYF